MATVLEMPQVQLTHPPTNPRKRKKRAPAAGAAVDCFKCSERKTKCDRRRPYCSQCLDAGQSCSGYKTQLTWGVGVASRGKLRGLSLPIAGIQGTTNTDPQSRAKKRRETTSEVPQILQQSPSLQSPAQESRYAPSRVSPILPPTTSLENSAVAPCSSQNMIWDPTFFSAPHSAYSHDFTTSTSRYHSAASALPQEYESSSHQSATLFRDASWQPQNVSTSGYYGTNVPTTPTTPTTAPLDMTTNSHFERAPSYLVNASLLSPAEVHLPDNSAHPEKGYDGISMLLEAGHSVQVPSSDIAIEDVDEELETVQYKDCAASDKLAMLQDTLPFDFSFPVNMVPGFGNIGKTVRMQYLINYYAEVISPVIVAFDSPSNPFRTQLLRLAESSETLQHAISALAASNLRQRRGIGLLSTGRTAPARRSSFAHVHLSGEYAQSLLSAEEQIREETLHKRLAVSQLNQQLAHPVLRKEDSILATLLILCLFHICDSGIAKFQTQFAGVRKLLTLRGNNSKIGSEDSRWMSRLFTWFDSLAATVNDREGQMSGPFLETSALCGDWALENMAGIDAQLFRSVSKLGRLNLLKQGKPVTSTDEHGPIPPISFTCSSSFVDGNGWVPSGAHVDLEGLALGPDYNRRFWQECNEVKQELMSWSLDTTLFDSISSESSYLTVDQRADLENISQSFRFSALIYVERLAHPQILSGDESIQRWVRQALAHITKVVSDVYLLWPLFITGTETIHEEGRNLIRGRCASIQQDSGFVNNASCLQLLEKVWSAHSPATDPRSDRENTAGKSTRPDQSSFSSFTFRDVMMEEAARTPGAGEYLVI